MILTVTPNSSLDRVLFIDEWITGTNMRTEKVITSVGGKGLDSSVVLRHLGVETVGLVFVAGSVGRELIQLVEQYGITPDPVWVGGETRIAHVIVETKHNRHSHVTSGQLVIDRDQLQEFIQRLRSRVRSAAWVICAGSLPPGVPSSLYCTITEEAAQAGVPVLIDSACDAIAQALPAHPTIIKMNWQEFEQTFGLKAPTLGDLKQAATDVYRDRDLQGLVLTCAEDGILAFSEEGAFYAVAPPQKAVNAAGAGDAVSAALSWRLSEGDSWPVALKWAAATAAAAVLTEGTADCRMDDILRIYPEVRIQKL